MKKTGIRFVSVVLAVMLTLTMTCGMFISANAKDAPAVPFSSTRFGMLVDSAAESKALTAEGTFTYGSDASSFSAPATVCISGDKLFATVRLSIFNLNLLVTNNEAYIMLPLLRLYAKLSADKVCGLLGIETPDDGYNGLFKILWNYADALDMEIACSDTKDNEEYNGGTYYRETFSAIRMDGSINYSDSFNCYFSGNDLKHVEKANAGYSSYKLDLDSIKPSVDSNVSFEMQPFYFDITSLAMMLIGMFIG